MRREPFYQFILYTLLREGKSNVPFKLEALLLGKQRASRHFFGILFKGCDISSFMNMKEAFEKEKVLYPLEIKEEAIEKDVNGLMTGHLL